MAAEGPQGEDKIRSFLDEVEAYVKAQPREKVRRIRVNRAALMAFLLLGVPSGVMLLLSFLAYWGIVLDSLRALWRPEPSEDVKWLLAGVAFFVTVHDLLRAR